MENKIIRIGMLGCGTVGTAFVHALEQQRDVVSARTNVQLEIVKIAVRDRTKSRELPVSNSILTEDLNEVVDDSSIDIIVELMGGIDPAGELLIRAMQSGKFVVTANKELDANRGEELFRTAREAKVDFLFEAAVGGGIPLVRSIRESLAGEHITRILGIINGTTNYILTQMSQNSVSYIDALKKAQDLGYAEADPTADVDGFDAGAKISILATLAFGSKVVARDVYHEGIRNIRLEDIDFVRRKGYVVKLVAIAEQFLPTIENVVQKEISVRVHPMLIPIGHPLATVNDSFNAVFLQGINVGDVMLYGRGAGGGPTASAVFGDVIDAATNIRHGNFSPIDVQEVANIRSIDETSTAYFMSIDVLDEPGVLAQVTKIFSEHRISIQSMEQEGYGKEARLVFITHAVQESDMQQTLQALNSLSVVQRVGSALRVLESE